MGSCKGDVENIRRLMEITVQESSFPEEVNELETAWGTVITFMPTAVRQALYEAKLLEIICEDSADCIRNGENRCPWDTNQPCGVPEDMALNDHDFIKETVITRPRFRTAKPDKTT